VFLLSALKRPYQGNACLLALMRAKLHKLLHKKKIIRTSAKFSRSQAVTHADVSRSNLCRILVWKRSVLSATRGSEEHLKSTEVFMDAKHVVGGVGLAFQPCRKEKNLVGNFCLKRDEYTRTPNTVFSRHLSECMKGTN